MDLTSWLPEYTRVQKYLGDSTSPWLAEVCPLGLRMVQKKNQHGCFILRGLRDTEQDLEHEPQCPPHRDL